MFCTHLNVVTETLRFNFVCTIVPLSHLVIRNYLSYSEMTRTEQQKVLLCNIFYN